MLWTSDSHQSNIQPQVGHKEISLTENKQPGWSIQITLKKRKNPISAFLVTEGYTFMSECRVRSFGWRPPTMIDQLKGEKYGKYYSPQSVFINEKHRAMLIYSIHLNTFKSLLCVHYFEDISTYMKERKLQDVRSWKWDNCKFAFRSVPHWWNFHRQIDRKVKLNLEFSRLYNTWW